MAQPQKANNAGFSFFDHCSDDAGGQNAEIMPNSNPHEFLTHPPTTGFNEFPPGYDEPSAHESFARTKFHQEARVDPRLRNLTSTKRVSTDGEGSYRRLRNGRSEDTFSGLSLRDTPERTNPEDLDFATAGMEFQSELNNVGNTNFFVQPGEELIAASSGHFKCTVTGCERSYSKRGELNRHMKIHSNKQHLCPKELCPRGVTGKGFPRNDKLIDHLHSKHKLEREMAKYLAAGGKQTSSASSLTSAERNGTLGDMK